MESHTPKHVRYNVFYNELCRYYKICSNRYNFLHKINNTFNLLLIRGYQRNLLIKGIKQFFNKDISKMGKFGINNIEEVIIQL